ncbi:MAG: lipid II flippase MurJ [bacterium]
MNTRVIGVASVLWGAGILPAQPGHRAHPRVGHRAHARQRRRDRLYLTAFDLPDFLNYLLAGGVLSIVFIPIFQRYLARDDEDGGWRAFSAIANPLVLLLVVGVALMWVATPWLTRLLFDFEPQHFAQLDRLVRIKSASTLQVFHIIGGLLAATLMARDRHALPAFAPLVYSGCIVGGGAGARAEPRRRRLRVGALIGSALGLFALPLAGALKHGLRWTPVLDLRHPDLRRYVLPAAGDARRLDRRVPSTCWCRSTSRAA